MVVLDQNQIKLDATHSLFIGIKTIRNEFRHVGIIYRENEESNRICHLGWHHQLLDEPLDISYFWCPTGLDDCNARIVSALVQGIAKNAQEVPYGLEYNGPCFSESGRYIAMPVGKGLTCSTFVLSVFERFGFILLDKASWPNREEDAKWQKFVVEQLTASGASTDHVEMMKNDIASEGT